MKRTWQDTGWRKRFAILPEFLSDGPAKTLIWLEVYWSRPMGEYTEISLTKPESGAHREAGE